MSLLRALTNANRAADEERREEARDNRDAAQKAEIKRLTAALVSEYARGRAEAVRDAATHLRTSGTDMIGWRRACADLIEKHEAERVKP